MVATDGGLVLEAGGADVDVPPVIGGDDPDVTGGVGAVEESCAKTWKERVRKKSTAIENMRNERRDCMAATITTTTVERKVEVRSRAGG